MFSYKKLDNTESELFKNLMHVFGQVFDDMESYQKSPPSDEYIQKFLNDQSHIVLVATYEQKVIGGLVAYELKKFEQERSEIYLYDLAILKEHQRLGVGSGLIEKLKEVAQEMNAYVIFVQADKGDAEAISFYRSLSDEEIEANHFDIKVQK